MNINYHENIIAAANNNTDYRRVVYIAGHTEITLMNLVSSEDIPAEIHYDRDQTLLVVSGVASIQIGDEIKILSMGGIITVPANRVHYVNNIGGSDLKLISIYNPPEHTLGRVDKVQPKHSEE